MVGTSVVVVVEVVLGANWAGIWGFGSLFAALNSASLCRCLSNSR